MNDLLKNLKRGMSIVMSLLICLAICTPVYAVEGHLGLALHAGAGDILHREVELTPVQKLAAAGEAAQLQKEQAESKEAESKEAEPVKTEEAEPQEPEIKIVMANVKDAVNVRAEANEEAEVVGKLFKNCGGTIIDRKDGWTYLESGELKGWTKDEYLFFGEEAKALWEEVGTLKATVKTDALRVRKEASEEAGVYGVLKLNDTVTAIEELGEWVSIQYKKDTVGYVASEYVDVEFSVEKGKTKEQIAKEEAEKEKKKLSENRGAVAVEVNDVTLLAALIQCEAGSESYEGKLAVGAVVMNRVRSGGYPNSVSGVIYAKGQFPPATNGKVAAVAAKGPSSSCVQAAQAAINGATNVGGATHFRRAGSAQGIVIGNHVFW